MKVYLVRVGCRFAEQTVGIFSSRIEATKASKEFKTKEFPISYRIVDSYTLDKKV